MIETHRQPIGIEVIQSLNIVITTTWVDTIVAPNTNVVRKRVVVESIINLGHGLGKFLMGRSLNWSLGLPSANTGIVGTPKMVFTNLIMTTHVQKTTYRPLMNSITIGGYKSTNAENP